jgi:hypothetical protein
MIAAMQHFPDARTMAFMRNSGLRRVHRGREPSVPSMQYKRGVYVKDDILFIFQKDFAEAIGYEEDVRLDAAQRHIRRV